MILSQPGSELLTGAESILFVGAGGGYDVFGAVPLVAGLLAEGKRDTGHSALAESQRPRLTFSKV